MPFTVLLNPLRSQTSGAYPPSVLLNVPDPEKAPIGIIRVLIGIQVRAGGMPVKFREVDNVDDISID